MFVLQTAGSSSEGISGGSEGDLDGIVKIAGFNLPRLKRDAMQLNHLEAQS